MRVEFEPLYLLALRLYFLTIHAGASVNTDQEKEALPSGPSEVQATGAASDVVSTSPAPEVLISPRFLVLKPVKPSPQAASEATTAAEPSKPSFKVSVFPVH